MGLNSEIIVWDGKSSADMDLIIASIPKYSIPERKMDVISVPGRNGDIIISQDAYSNVIVKYDLAILGLRDSLNRSVREIIEWLTKPTGYARLEDSYEPDVYRMAYYRKALDITNRFMTIGRATVEFNCKPQRFLKDGEVPVKIQNGMRLTNPSVYTAKPIILVKGSGSAYLTVGASTISISDIGTSIEIDCDSQSAYSGSTNKNDKITLTNGDFPQLKAGVTQISWNGSGVTEVIITPRWWIL